MYFRIYNNMNIKVLTFTRLCYFVFLANWFHMIISFLHKPGQVSRCMALVPPVFCTGLWMACLNLTGQPLHKGRNWGSWMGQQPVLSYCIMWRDHVAWPCGVKCFWYLLQTGAWWPVNWVCCVLCGAVWTTTRTFQTRAVCQQDMMWWWRPA